MPEKKLPPAALAPGPLKLSPQQEQVCEYLAKQLNRTQISKLLGLRLHEVNAIYHTPEVQRFLATLKEDARKIWATGFEKALSVLTSDMDNPDAAVRQKAVDTYLRAAGAYKQGLAAADPTRSSSLSDELDRVMRPEVHVHVDARPAPAPPEPVVDLSRHA